MSNYVIENSLVDASKYKIKAPYAMVPEYITIHNTANDASADNEIAYMKRNDNQISFHAAIDDKKVIIGVPYTRTAWHCGDGKGKGNMKSIGLEICYSKSGGAKYTKAEENTVVYVAKLLKQYGWGIERVKKHQDWSGKNCPHRILDEGRWKSFLSRIEKELKSLNAVKPVAKPAPTPTPKVDTAKPIGTATILVDSLNYYNSPRWSDPSGTVKKGDVFTVMDRVSVDGAYQFRLKSGTYITASEKYVTFYR